MNNISVSIYTSVMIVTCVPLSFEFLDFYVISCLAPCFEAFWDCFDCLPISPCVQVFQSWFVGCRLCVPAPVPGFDSPGLSFIFLFNKYCCKQLDIDLSSSLLTCYNFHHQTYYIWRDTKGLLVLFSNKYFLGKGFKISA